MTYKVFYVNDLRECCYVVDCGSQKCVVIDPGMQNAGECGRIADYIRSKELEPAAILLTHAHFDHIMGVNFILRNWNIPVYMNQADERQAISMPRNKLYFININIIINSNIFIYAIFCIMKCCSSNSASHNFNRL